MDIPPSYTQCSTHPSIEDCLEHALNNGPRTVLQSERMKKCLQRFMSRCTVAERELFESEPSATKNLKPRLRPLAPRIAQPHTEPSLEQSGPAQTHPGTSGPDRPDSSARPNEAGETANAASNPSKRTPASSTPFSRHPSVPKPNLEPPTATKPSRNPAPTQSQASSNKSVGKRKRVRSASVQTIPSDYSGQSESETSSSSTDTSDGRSLRRRTGLSSSQKQPGRIVRAASQLDLDQGKIYFKGFDITKIVAALDAFYTVEECESMTLPALGELRNIKLMANIQSSETDSRLKRHIDMLKSLKEKSEKTQVAMALFDRIWVLMVQFEVEMLKPNSDDQLQQGLTRQAYAKAKVAELWRQTENFIKRNLQMANRFMLLLEDEPSYLAELKPHQAKPWLALKDVEATAISKYFKEIQPRKSAWRPQRNFLVCKHIIESLSALDWTLFEIAQSETRLAKVLGKYVDMDGLAAGEVRECRESSNRDSLDLDFSRAGRGTWSPSMNFDSEFHLGSDSGLFLTNQDFNAFFLGDGLESDLNLIDT